VTRTSRPARRTFGAAVRALTALLALVLLAGCSAAAQELTPERTWVPKPEGPPPAEEPGPQLPGEPGPTDSQTPSGPEAPGQPDDPSVVATGLALPWGLAVLPDNTAIVGERKTGRVLQVQPERAPVKQLMKIGGIDASGDGGLLDIALSPAYRQDGLVFAYLTTKTDNRVVRFELGGPVTPVITGIPRGATGNGGRLAFGTDGLLYVGTGDAGKPAQAADLRTLAGKVLRVTTFGRPAPGNPNPNSPIFSRGSHNVDGLCLDGRNQVYDTEAGSTADEINRISGGGNYGWPSAGSATAIGPVRTLAPGTAGVGGCAVIERGLFVAALRGQRLWTIPLDDTGVAGTPRAVLAGTYGRLRTVVAAADGALWLTTSNRDGFGKPVAQDDRVIRIMPPTNTTNSPA
jgi:glucose/arabinose dehydrogenase